MIVVTMFLISEVPVAVASFLGLVWNEADAMSCKYLALFHQLVVSISCSYSILCYWATSTLYKKTLVSLRRKSGPTDPGSEAFEMKPLRREES